MDDSSQQPEEKSEGSIGPSAAIIIVVVLVALCGVYFLLTESTRFHRTPVQQSVSV